MRLQHIILESDVLIMINELKVNEENLSELGCLLSSFLFSLNLSFVFFLHIGRIRNKSAHLLAKMGIYLDSPLKLIEHST